jgi:prepilin peptidase CpaA
MSGLAEALSSIDLRLAGSREAAAWFLVFAAPISAWVAWHDMATMRIPNRTVILLAACFLVVGLAVLPLADYGWRVAQMAIVLVVGFVLHQIGGLGAGDVKFAAAAVGMIAPGDVQFMILLFASVLLAAFATHRFARALPAVRGLAPGWTSWTRRDFPMGFALGGTLVFYLLLVTRFGT